MREGKKEMSSSSSSSNLRARNRRFNISGDQIQTTPPPPPLTDSIDDHTTFVPANNVIDIMENPNYHRRRLELVHDGPPLDDCCPICFGNFTIPCKSSCGHWYCGSCILRYWSYCAMTMPCKCPKCTRRITKLTPEASLLDQKEEDVVRVLGQVAEYNYLFVGGMRGLVQKVRLSPLFLKRFFLRLMDPDTTVADFFFLLRIMRCFAELLGVLYIAFSFNFIPTGMLFPWKTLLLVLQFIARPWETTYVTHSLVVDIVILGFLTFLLVQGGLEVTGLFECSAIILVIILRLVGIYRRHRLRQRVREMAAANPLLE